MKILRLSTLSLSLAIAVFSLGYVNPSFAGKKCDADTNHPRCKPSDDDSPSENLSATFCLTIVLTDPEYIRWDGIGAPAEEYCDDRKEKVAAFTGSGDGFRWDTNMQNTNKIQHGMRWRWVHMKIDNDPPAAPPGDRFEIDFRFNQTVGLDLGSLDAQVSGDNGGLVCPDGLFCDGQVAATMRYYAGNAVVDYNFKNYGILGFGGVNTPFPTEQDDKDKDCLKAEVDESGTVPGMIKVTRISGTQWTLESPAIGTACRFSLDAGGNKCTFTNERCDGPELPRVIDFEFLFTITQQD